jgi:Protein of unknown function (DUF4231)
MAKNASNHPPKTRLVIRVGVTGHRPNHLKDSDVPLLRRQIHRALQSVRNAGAEIAGDSLAGYDSHEPQFRIISPLAEGSDRLVAEEGLALGYELQAPLPFPADDYENDFAAPESKKHFRELLNQATAVLELDGSRENQDSQNRAYESVGRTVLRHCDILIAIWDGAEARSQGGTAQIVAEAAQLRIPTVWIKTLAPHDSCILIATEAGGRCQLNIEELEKQLITQMGFQLTEDAGSSGRKSVDRRETYFREKPHTWTFGVLFRIFSRLIAGSNPWPVRILQRDYKKETHEEWKSAWAVSHGLPADAKHQVETKFLLHYAWADKLANHFANLYRSSFVINYLLAAAAVLFALRAFFSGKKQHLWVAVELSSIVLIILITTMGRRKRWHERWIDYRSLAEKLRQMRFLFLIGRFSKTDHLSEHSLRGTPRKTWVDWHFQAAVREAGMLRGNLERSYCLAYRKLLIEYEITSQIQYHARNSQSNGRVDRNLQWLATGLFFSTLLVCSVHLFDKNVLHQIYLVQMAALLPAFGAAIHGINSQGDFRNVARRSADMNKWLSNILTRLRMAGDEISSDELAAFAEEAAGVMGADLLDWRVDFQEKPLVFPS